MASRMRALRRTWPVLDFMGVAPFGAIAATLATVFLKSLPTERCLVVHIARLEAKIDQFVEGRAAEG